MGHPLMKAVSLLLALLGAAASSLALEPEAFRPSSYTNHAGNVISGIVIALDARTATFSNVTETVTLPLSIFPESEQRRLAADFGQPRVPESVRRAIEGAERAIARSRLRAEKGLCTPEESADFIARTQSALSAYLDAQLASGAITPAERAAFGH